MATRLKRGALLLFGLALASLARGADSGLPAWVDQVGAKAAPPAQPAYSARAFGAAADGRTLDTAAIQHAIDACAQRGGGTVTLEPGHYLTGALFLKDGVRLHLDKGVVLEATTDESAYPVMPTRVAGIEMSWPAAVLNVIGRHKVAIDGEGIVDGSGPFWWKKYWDMRRSYDPRGLRWAADYDCGRVRLLTVYNSSDVTLSGLTLRRSGFWTVQITYSERVTVDHIAITGNFAEGGIKGPSTDGVDIDSSRYVLVQGCDIDNNDDDICLKAGRDSDGLRVNRPTEYVLIRDNICRRGAGVLAFGSETSGFIRHVVALHNTGLGTSEGMRLKSTRTRGGGVEDLLVRDLTLRDVPRPFTFTTDWSPDYNSVKIPADIPHPPAYWRVLAAQVPPERGHPIFRDIVIEQVRATGARRILTASGTPGLPIGPVRWKDIRAAGAEAGSVSHASDWTMSDVVFETADGKPLRLSDCARVDSPQVLHK